MPATKNKPTTVELMDHSEAELKQMLKSKAIPQAQYDEVRTAQKKAADDLEAAKQTGKPSGLPTPTNGDKEVKVCPVTLAQVMRSSPLVVKIGDVVVSADPKSFSTGSYGFFFNGKVTLEIDGVKVPFQVGMNITAVNSKPKG